MSPGACKSIDWKGRKAVLLSNGMIELTVLTGGGHLAELRFIEQKGQRSENIFWEAPWLTVDPDDSRFQKLASAYGTEAGGFLAGYTGHALCLDYFGAPSVEQAAAGFSIHGEATTRSWNAMPYPNPDEAACRWDVQLPQAQLRLEREIHLGNRESVVYVEERVHNQRSTDHACHWVQHAAFGPPFLSGAECSFRASALRGKTSSFGYEDRSLLAKNREFQWPFAPREEGDEFAADPDIDLRQPFSAKGRGFLAGAQMDPKRKMQYVLAVNWKLRLGVGYCFRQKDFPWMAIWEENCVRQYSPWNGRSQVRGMEFGTTPMPPAPGEGFPGTKLFDAPTWCVIPANGVKKTRYLIFLATIPAGMNSIENVEAEGDAICLYGADGNSFFSIPAQGCEAFLAD